MKMKYIDFAPVTASAVVIGILASLAKCAVNPIALYAASGIAVIIISQALGLKYVGSVSELTGVRPAALNFHFCANLLVAAFVLAVTYGGTGN